MFVTTQHDGIGEVKKTKSRLVINGSTVNLDELEDIYSPTVQPICVMTMIAVAANKGYELAVFDVKGAYLIPEVSKDEPDIIMMLDRKVSKIFVKVYPNLSEFLNNEGCMYMLVQKYLYGLPQASMHFNKHLTRSLKSMNMKVAKVDKCLFVRTGVNDSRVSATTWVDDVLVAALSSEMDLFEKEFGSIYKITITREES